MKISRMPTAAVLGVTSGALSFLTIKYYPDVFTLASLIPGAEKGMSLVPGVIFGVAVALSMVVTGAAGRLPALVGAVLIVLAAWGAAYHASVLALPYVETLVPTAMDKAGQELLSLSLAMNVGNLIGGIATMVAAGLAAGRRVPGSTVVLALIAGSLSVFAALYGARDSKDGENLAILFILWQTAMLSVVHASFMRLDDEAARAARGGRPARP
jgi:hypothetical protein